MLNRGVAWFEAQRKNFPNVAAVGITSFGQMKPVKDHPSYGFITNTPKLDWSGTDVVGPFRRLGLPIAFEHDVIAACAGEFAFGAGRGIRDGIYMTISTGIGVAIFINGRPVHGQRPEAGHQRIERLPGDDFAGVCPYHGGCLEGLASGTAISTRTRIPGEQLTPDHPAMALSAAYAGIALANLTLIVMPERIIIGGGVAAGGGETFFNNVRRSFQKTIGGYLQHPAVEDGMNFIRPAELNSPGLVGAMVIAQESLADSRA